MNDRITTLFKLCADITTSKGFDVTQHNSQVLLMGTEIGEALENHSSNSNPIINDYVYRYISLMRQFEGYRKSINPEAFQDCSIVLREAEHLEELADLFIRLGSYIGGNGLTDKFIVSVFNKISKNKQRPFRHGKGF